MSQHPSLPLEIMASTARYIPAISSMSLGRAWNHDIAPKLAACSRHGYKAIEVFYEDLEYAARSLPTSYPAAPPKTSFPDSTEWDEQQLAAASYIRHLCDKDDLSILCLQPFMHYEGLLSRLEHSKRLKKLSLWFRIAQTLQTDLIQIPSTFLPPSQCTSNLSCIVSDFREVAELGLQQSPPIRFAYEALCWGTHVNTWDAAYDIIKAVDRPNFGACIDTFNLAGRVYGDPTSPSGKTPTAEADMAASLAKLRMADVSKIFYVEVVDAERLASPLVEGHPWYKPEQNPRMSWSRNARLFPFERNAYLPILDILKVLTEELGYTGYISFELFNRSMNEAGVNVPEDHAARGARSWGKLCQFMSWKEEELQQLGLVDGAEADELAELSPSHDSVMKRSRRSSEEAGQSQIQLTPSKL
jgi:4-hydroxyphenylpyruvate dioxygenase